MCTVVSFPEGKLPDSEADHHLYVVPRLRMSVALPPLPLYSFTAYTRTANNFYCNFEIGLEPIPDQLQH